MNIYRELSTAIKELRLSTGLSQKNFCEKVGIPSRESLSNYERHARTYPLGDVMSVLNFTKTKLILENFSLKIEKGDALIMENNFKKYNERFEDFKFEIFRQRYSEDRKLATKKREDELMRIVSEMEKEGYKFNFHINSSQPALGKFWDADEFYPDDVVEITKDSRTIKLAASGGQEYDYLNLEQFITDLEQVNMIAAKYIQKAIIYTCLRENIGRELFNLLEYNLNRDSLLKLIPLLDGFEDIFIDTFNKDSHIASLSYEPIPLQEDFETPCLAFIFNILDCKSQNYPWFVYVMDEEDILDDVSFESHDMIEALSCTPSYFDNFDEIIAENSSTDD